MILRKLSAIEPSNLPPETDGWSRNWAGGGYWVQQKCFSSHFHSVAEAVHTVPEGALSERQFESLLFLSMIDNIDKSQVEMFELGAACGDWSLALAGIIDFGLIPCKQLKYRCLALEPEPVHYMWMVEHFQKQGINAIPVYGAIRDYNGTCEIDVTDNPADSYGQDVLSSQRLRKIAKKFLRKTRISRVTNRVRYLSMGPDRKGLRVPCFTVDKLMADFAFDRLDILHMDVQYSEVEAIKGARKAIERGSIDFIKIETHTSELHRKLENILSADYNAIINLPFTGGLHNTPLGQVYLPQDGIQLWEYKNRPIENALSAND